MVQDSDLIYDLCNDEMKLNKLDFSRQRQPQTHTLKNENTEEISTSSSFQSLLAQNEDLAARLRVTLKRLSHLENQNKFLKDDAEQGHHQLQILNDQLLVWKEKEKIWLEKEGQFESQHRAALNEKELEISLLRQKVEKLSQAESENERFRKYQEKIKSTVKPYVQKLKSYAETLFQQTQELNSQLLNKEAYIDKLTLELAEIKARQETVLRKTEEEKSQLIQLFESQRSDLKNEIKSIREENETLNEKTRIFDRCLERQDELENLVVALRRSKEDIESKLEQEMDSLKKTSQHLSQEKILLQVNLKNKIDETLKLKEQLLQLETSQAELQEQLTSLRFLWSQKSQECERATISLHALEKINLELSQKLKELREKES
jgi:hypothetical protein